MKNGLSCTGSGIHHRAVSRSQLEFSRQIRRYELQSAQYRLIFGRGLIQRGKMLARDDQDMRRRLGSDVFKRENVFILINHLGGNLLCSDFAKQTIGTHGLPPPPASSKRKMIGLTASSPDICSPRWWAAGSPDILPTLTRSSAPLAVGGAPIWSGESPARSRVRKRSAFARSPNAPICTVKYPA